MSLFLAICVFALGLIMMFGGFFMSAGALTPKLRAMGGGLFCLGFSMVCSGLKMSFDLSHPPPQTPSPSAKNL
jgi:hypothetical protein